MIKKFDMGAQEQIHSSLDELCALLERALRLLRRIGGPGTRGSLASPKLNPSSSQKSKIPSLEEASSPSKAAGASGPFPRSSNPTMQLLKWSFRDKKDITAILEQFADVNDRLLEMIRFWSLASEIGVDIRHLHHLRNDEDAVTLGFRDDASLALAVSDTNHITDSFELDPSWNNVLRDSKSVENRFAIFEWGGKIILQENCVFLPHEEEGIDPQTRNRINSLAGLLH